MMSESAVAYTLTNEQIDQIVDRLFKRVLDARSEDLPGTCTKSAAARHLGVTRVTVYNMIADGRLKSTADGKRVITQSVIEYELGITDVDKKDKKSRKGHKQYV